LFAQFQYPLVNPKKQKAARPRGLIKQ